MYLLFLDESESQTIGQRELYGPTLTSSLLLELMVVFKLVISPSFAVLLLLLLALLLLSDNNLGIKVRLLFKLGNITFIL
jgi:hypothetical protein